MSRVYFFLFRGICSEWRSKGEQGHVRGGVMKEKDLSPCLESRKGAADKGGWGECWAAEAGAQLGRKGIGWWT